MAILGNFFRKYLGIIGKFSVFGDFSRTYIEGKYEYRRRFHEK